jgi:hypothetical protein
LGEFKKAGGHPQFPRQEINLLYLFFKYVGRLVVHSPKSPVLGDFFKNTSPLKRDVK